MCKSPIYTSTGEDCCAADDDGGGRDAPFYTDQFPYSAAVTRDRAEAVAARQNDTDAVDGRIALERQFDRRDAIKARLWPEDEPDRRMKRPKHSRPTMGWLDDWN